MPTSSPENPRSCTSREINALVFFASARGYGLIPFQIRWLSWSRFSHVAIGYGGAVLDPGLKGNSYWPLDAFLAHYPTLLCAFVVPLRRPVDLDRYQRGHRVRKRVWPTLCRWLARRKAATTDCVYTALCALWWGGLRPPLRTVSPQQLHRWLESQGYEQIRLDTAEQRAAARHRFAA